MTPGVDDYGLWAQDPKGQLKLVLRRGDQVDVDNGPGVDLRTVDFIDAGFYGSGADPPHTFNDKGQILLSLQFTDGSSGLFVSNAAVPEPTTIALLAAAMACWGLPDSDDLRSR